MNFSIFKIVARQRLLKNLSPLSYFEASTTYCFGEDYEGLSLVVLLLLLA